MMGRILQTRYRKGIMKPGAVASIVAAATAVNLYLLSPGRTCVIRKLHIFNRTGGNVQITIGTGFPPAAFVPRLPIILAVNGVDLELTETDIEEAEFAVNITVQSNAAAAAPNDVQIQATVEEFQGPTG